MIQPSIGRAVWLYQTHAEYARGHQAFAVTVAYVHNDRLINVGGLNHDGNVIVFRSVPLLQDDDQPPDGGKPFCTWMPFQKSQAAKTDMVVDALEPRVKALEDLVRAMTTPAQDPPAQGTVGQLIADTDTSLKEVDRMVGAARGADAAGTVTGDGSVPLSSAAAAGQAPAA